MPLLLRIILWCLYFLHLGEASYKDPLMVPMRDTSLDASPSLSFTAMWQVLGPFQIGTREATWGADPLEYVGGFNNISYDPSATIWSSLPKDGQAKWDIIMAPTQSLQLPKSASIALKFGYSNVDWGFLRTIYGWAAVQYQAWARGELTVNGNEAMDVLIYTDNVLEYWIDDEPHFGGDYYSFRNAPLVLRLKPGAHKIELRLMRDVRASGGILEPMIEVAITAQQASSQLELAESGILMSDIVDGSLAAPIASVSLRNSGKEDVEVVKIQLLESGFDEYTNTKIDYQLDESNCEPSAKDHDDLRVSIIGGQTRPIAFNISIPPNESLSIAYKVIYKHLESGHCSHVVVSQDLRHTSISKPHKITFLHPGGIVSYAMLRPPARNALCHSRRNSLPIVLALHGAGVEADNIMVTSALDAVSDLCAWVLYPTGVTTWSGDDWHNWGFADIEVAIQAIPHWMETVSWTGPGVELDRWIVIGHSNGGQGTWYAITHWPDKILAAAPISGYASIQKYVPYELWQPADPRRTAIVGASLNDYRHEMLLPNIRGIPMQQQHGSTDENVPTYNSRLLAQQLHMAGAPSDYAEISGKGHWWEGVMTTPNLVHFYYKQVRNEDVLPRRLEEFNIVVADPGSMGRKEGIKITHLKDPGQYGRVEAKGRILKTSNVLSLDFDPKIWTTTVTIDGQTLELAQTGPTATSKLRAYHLGGEWIITSIEAEHASIKRSQRQLGSISAMLRTNGPFVIRYSNTDNMSRLGLQISRNLYQYFRADSLVVSSYSTPSNTTGNFITLIVGDGPEDNNKFDFPIRVSGTGVNIRDSQGHHHSYGYEGRGAAFIQPLGSDGLELILWGADEDGLQQAVRMVPMLTGVGQPDFVVLSRSAKWKGIDGVLAMGFFGADWEVAASSII